MKKLLLPILILVTGIGGGAAAGFFLRPTPDPALEASATEAEPEEVEAVDPDAPASEFVRLNNQFVVPLVKDSGITGLVILSLSIEVPGGQKSAVYEREPKLRDAFNEVLFRHANTGGFEGVFTSAPKMNALRMSLLESATAIMGDMAVAVLVTDIVRQDS